MKSQNLACCCWALSGADEQVLAQIADVGFRKIDLRAEDFRAEASLKSMDSWGLSVSCLGASFGIPQGATLSSADTASATAARSAVVAGLERTAALGAATSYIIPDLDATPDALARYADSLVLLGDRAQELGLRLCIEHFPGRVLPTVASTLSFLRKINHPALALLYDIGHVQISGEDIGETIAAAGSLLGYVHLDDNDGVGDLHWSLLDGVMTPASLRELFDALEAIDYQSGISIELSPALPDPLNAIRRSWEILHQP